MSGETVVYRNEFIPIKTFYKYWSRFILYIMQ